MNTFTAAALQLGPASETISATTDRICALLDQAAGAGVRFAVLPELALTPYFAAQVRDTVEPFVSVVENTKALARIAAKAKQHAMSVVVFFAEKTDAGLYNSMAFYDESGSQTGLHRKVHIPGKVEPDPSKPLNILEKRYFKAGDLGFGVYPTSGVNAGGLICYDRRFPESYRSLMLNGADLFCVGYNTPVMDGGTQEDGQRASELAICGGAYSNGTWAIASGKAGVELGTTFIGGSFICSPKGDIVAKAKTEGDEVITAQIDMALQEQVRARWAFAENRMEEAYTLSPPATRMSGAA
ncbi:N-carbamoyl-D-amino acid hydrolase [Aquimixticola soesokkakensis]|uniref:N-carbamoyl-D-amino acid hydrolase n=1 Tax=Aquimixticola soesokkakensis TaxID=1519096 RepID=A0A1Y5TCC1_9RHOB|nr:nitrilase-related carbon-nitrogen hydrolase [Aquimixticola soesokkakensis]SLN57195.1 N-carbamoyl-D-amino acid hydrolase [Aquimixticola soesokkakensis]